MTELADALVVLGCRVRRTGEPSAALSRRVRMAARGFADRAAPRVVASGGRSWNGHVEALVMKRELVARGVPERAVEPELRSCNTRENAWFCAPLLRDMRAHRVVLVTCPWHLPRSLELFRRLGITAVAPPDEWFASVQAPAASRLVQMREWAGRWVDSALVRLRAPRFAK